MSSLDKTFKLLCLFGPTAVGKTETLKTLFSTGFEFINADSMSVYRHMDIGTAKPQADLLKDFPHHLIDIVNPDYQFNVGEFVKRAETVIPEIIKRGNHPVLVGGTAYYFKCFAFGLPRTPKSTKFMRRKVLRLESERGLPSLYDELCGVDPDYAKKIGVNDKSRILRALEVYYTTGSALSDFAVPRGLRDDYEFLFIGLRRPKEELNTHIDSRVEEMFRRGLVKEVKALLELNYSWQDPGMRGIGYRELACYRKGCHSIEYIKDLVKKNTRQYAKRQLTFFKSLPAVKWIHPDHLESLREEINRFYGYGGV